MRTEIVTGLSRIGDTDSPVIRDLKMRLAQESRRANKAEQSEALKHSELLTARIQIGKYQREIVDLKRENADLKWKLEGLAK